MSTVPSTHPTGISRSHRNLLVAASSLTYVLIVMGGIVSTTASGLGCPDWPTCYGQIVPPVQIAAIIEYTHRFIAALTTPLIFAAAVIGWRNYQAVRLISRPPILSIVFLIIVIILGALTVLRGIPPWLAVIDLGSALLVLALMLTATAAACLQRANFKLPDRLALRGSFTQFALWTAVGVFVVLVSSVLVVDKDTVMRGLAFPLYGERIDLDNFQGWLRAARHLLGAVTSLMLVAVVVQAWRTRQEHPATVRTATILGTLFMIETIVGLLLAKTGAAIPLQITYVAAAVGLWAGIVVLTVLTGLETRAFEVNPQESMTASLPHRI